MSTYFSTAAARDKQQSWRMIVEAMFGPTDLDLAPGPDYFGEARCTPVGGLEVTGVRCDHEIAKRTKVHVARSKSECFVVAMLQSGTLQIHQFGRDALLLPGTLACFDLNSAYTYTHHGPTQVLAVKVPSVMLRACVRDPHALVGQVRTIESGAGRITADFVAGVAREAPGLPATVAAGYTLRMVEMLGLLLEGAGDGAPAGCPAAFSSIHRRCVLHIETHLADPALGPAAIAEAVGISVRYLHRIFQLRGCSVGAVLREMRLRRCHQDLTDGLKQHLSVGEIALRAGFHSQSHFATAFRKRYQRCPSDLRRSRPRPDPAV